MPYFPQLVRSAALFGAIALGAIGLAAAPAESHPHADLFRAIHGLGHMRSFHMNGGAHAQPFGGAHRSGGDGPDWRGSRHRHFGRDARLEPDRDVGWRHGHEWRRGRDGRGHGRHGSRGAHGWRDGFGRWHWIEGAGALASTLDGGDRYDDDYDTGDEDGYDRDSRGYADYRSGGYGYEDRDAYGDGDYDDEGGSDYCPCRDGGGYDDAEGEGGWPR